MTSDVADLARPDDCAAVVASAVRAFGRVGEAEDIARCALFVASDDASFISGTHSEVDGGAMAATAWRSRRRTGAQRARLRETGGRG